MKKLAILFGLICCIGVSAQETSLMTFNIRYNNPNDGDDRWELRKEDVVQLIAYYKPSVMGIQEGKHEQVTFLNESLNSYQFVGVGRDDGKTAGEYSAIFYDSTKVKVMDNGTFWLSTTPDEVSVGWDASMERICTYALFEDLETEKKFWVFNTHFDHRGEQARLNAAALIVQKSKSMNIANLPVFIMGDLNAKQDSSPIKLLSNHYQDSHLENGYGPKGTFFGFDMNEIAENRIDYIFYKDAEVMSSRIIDDRRANNRHVSDHLPVLVKVKF